MVGWKPSKTCRPVWNCSWVAWSLSVVHIERTTARRSTQRARPVKPMATSARKGRRLSRPQQLGGSWEWLMAGPSAEGDEVVVVKEHLDEPLAGAPVGVGRRRQHRVGSGREGRQPRGRLD